MHSDSSASKSSSSSSSSRPSSSSSSSAKPSSSSAKPSSSSTSASSSSSKPSSSSGEEKTKPLVPTPHISANAWMSFFLLCCLVLIILQGPLGLTWGSPASALVPAWGAGAAASALSFGGLPGCAGFVAAAVPWCHPVVAQPQYAPPQPPPQAHVYVQQPAQPQMGGQGQVATPHGGSGWSWYANAQPGQLKVYTYHQRPALRACPGYTQVQYQRPGVQLQVQSAPPPPRYAQQEQFMSAGPAVPVVPAPVAAVESTPLGGLANLENAFYPLLVGAIALLVILDYAT